MKGFVFLGFLLFTTVFSARAQNGSAKIKLDEPRVDFGTIRKGSKGVEILSFVNTGDVPLIISNVRSSCGCTVPTWPKKPIKPGERGRIKVKYDTQRLGIIRKSISIMSNAVTGRKLVKVVGEVVPRRGEKRLQTGEKRPNP